MKSKIHTKKGISLVISLIMMTLLLSISFSISNIILRQMRLTNTSTNSQISFYAADSALECALYYDTSTDGSVGGAIESAIFGWTLPASTWPAGTNPVQCGNRNSNTPMSFTKVIAGEYATTTFAVDYSPHGCAQVLVAKNRFRTRISTSGYNVGVNGAGTGCDLNDAIARRVVERGLVFTH
ncbi:MAG: pilus assembly PilX N-terminal domain-containing protein [Patescibacteria group bacterium]